MRSTIMCAVVSLATLLLPATANSVDRVKLVPVGSSMIAIPLPKGFEERKIDREEEALRQRLSQNRVRFLASFSQKDGKQIDITVAPESEQLMVSPSQFGRIEKGPVKTQYLELLNKLEHELNISVNELLSDSHRDVLNSVRQKKKISHVPLGLIKDDNYSLSFADIGFIESKGDHPSDVVMLVSTNTMMLVSGKVMNLVILAPYQGKQTIAWIKSATLQLIDDVHETNKNVLYAAVGADTLRLTIPNGFSVSETPEEIVRYLKSEGGRVLASLEGRDPSLFNKRVDILYLVAEGVGREQEPFTYTLEEFQQIQANVKRNWKAIQEDMRENIDNMLPLASLARREQPVFFAEGKDYSSWREIDYLPAVAGSKAQRKIGTITNILVKGRALSMSIHVTYEDDPPIERIEEYTKQLIAELRKLNQ